MRLLTNALGEVRLEVDPRCKELIKDFEEVMFKPESGVIDKATRSARTHASDALGYAIWELFGEEQARARRTSGCFRGAERHKMIEIDREHPDFKRQRPMWRMYRDLYTGGQEFKHRAAEYLLRRQKEPLDVYGERLHRVFYENYIGSIVDWYASTLFRREPSLQFEGGMEAGQKFCRSFQKIATAGNEAVTIFFGNALWTLWSPGEAIS